MLRFMCSFVLDFSLRCLRVPFSPIASCTSMLFIHSYRCFAFSYRAADGLFHILFCMSFHIPFNMCVGRGCAYPFEKHGHASFRSIVIVVAAVDTLYAHVTRNFYSSLYMSLHTPFYNGPSHECTRRLHNNE